MQTTPATATVSARIANANTDALVIPNVSLAANGIFTAFAIGNKTGAGTKPLQVVLCNDTAPANGVLSSCTVAN